jgi:hypothetical protein
VIAVALQLWRPINFSQNQMMATSRTPNVLYAQDKNVIFLTIDLQDVTDPHITTTATNFGFDAEKENVKYHFDIELFDNVKPEVISF